MLAVVYGDREVVCGPKRVVGGLSERRLCEAEHTGEEAGLFVNKG